MRGWKGVAMVAVILVAYGWPAVAEANGEHIHFGAVHVHPIVAVGVAIFFGLITLMFVGQWIRFNAARRSAAGTALSRKPLREGKEDADDTG